jgi:hypothetical protein
MLSRLFAAIVLGAIGMAGGMAGAAHAQPGGSDARKEAPPPYVLTGPLHFIGLGVYDVGIFADPASVKKDGNAVEARVLTIQGKIWHVAEGDIKWQWETLKVACAARAWDVVTSDYYREDGSWVIGYPVQTQPTVKVQFPYQEALHAYLCDGARPAAFQEVVNIESAIAGITNAFANR